MGYTLIDRCGEIMPMGMVVNVLHLDFTSYILKKTFKKL